MAPGALLVAGDFQRTAWFERAIGREQNDEARETLIDALVAEPAGGLLLLGDLVFDGSTCGDWAAFDALVAPLRDRGVALALGNHDYWGPNVAACRHVRERFPWLAAETWEVVRWGRVALVVLDSNPGEMDAWETQREWFGETLSTLEEDASCRAVIVATHHPPYTNSAVTSDEPHAQELAAALEGHRKPLLFLSGHAHAYEHFVVDELHYVVSGGGGGPRVRLLRGAEQRHVDHFEGPSPRPFHYLRLRERSGGVQVEAVGFQPGDEAEVFDQFLLPWPAE